MTTKEDRKAALPYARIDQQRPLPDWGDLNVLLSVIRTGSLNKAAQTLSQTQSTVSRHIDRLELALGVKMLERTPNGASLTREGVGIVEELNIIRDNIARIVNRVKDPSAAKTETVRFITTDGIATYWLPRFLPYLFAQTNEIELRIHTANVAGQDRHENYDISIHFMQPNDPRARLVRLGTFHFIPYASPAYLQKHGYPMSPRDLAQHKLLDHAFYLIDKGTWKTRLPEMVQTPSVELFTNSSSVLVEAVRNGLGVAFLPTYVSLFERDLIPIDIGLHYATPIFLCWNDEASHRYGCRTVLHFLKHIFDKRTMPWLRDEFVAPKDFPTSSVHEIGSNFTLKPHLAHENRQAKSS